MTNEDRQTVIDAPDEHALNLFWHALNYRGAQTQHAELFWRELEACVQRMVDAATLAERERAAKVCERERMVRGGEVFAAEIRRG